MRNEVQRLEAVARRARSKGLDPTPEVEMRPADDVAGRVEGLVGPPGVAARIRELSDKMTPHDVAFEIAHEIVQSAKREGWSPEAVADQAIRTALAILTEGITAGPIEGIAEARIKFNADGSRYLAVYFAGPIRAAGGTEAAQTVIVADAVRQGLDLDRYKPSPDIVERYVEEVALYNRVSHLQYPSNPEEVRLAARSLPIEVTGEPTAEVEVTGYRDLPGVETNRLRGGAILVLNDSILGKAHKLAKLVKEMDLEGWDWLERLVPRRQSDKVIEPRIQPRAKFLEDIIAGRPVLAYPSRRGGFRIRYGRSRNTGLAALGVHPATMVILDNFVACGTQLIIERPGKGCVAMPVDSIHGPIVKLRNGSIRRIDTVAEAKRVSGDVARVLFLGDLLIAFGEFRENNHLLVPAGYCPEWWSKEVERALQQPDSARRRELYQYIRSDELARILKDPLRLDPNPQQALAISSTLGVPLHPRYIYFWENLSVQQLLALETWLQGLAVKCEDGCVVEMRGAVTTPIQAVLEELGVPCEVEGTEASFTEAAPILYEMFRGQKCCSPFQANDDITDALTALQKRWHIQLRPKGTFYVGARVGRPEKAKRREMDPPPHGIFPVGLAGGATRDILKAAEKSLVNVEAALRTCPQCGRASLFNTCPDCGAPTGSANWCAACRRLSKSALCEQCHGPTSPFGPVELSLKKELKRVRDILGGRLPTRVKGVKGLTSKRKIPELLEKAVLRAKHDLYVYKDGTIRFDMTDAPLTHFKPSEIRTSPDKLKQLGYEADVDGAPLKEESQLLELRTQDIVVPQECAEYLFRVSRFLDDLLTCVYGLEPFYQLSSPDDLVGHLVVGLAPHTSAGVIGRIIGFTPLRVCYAHPFWHAAKRRNCFPADTTIDVEIDGIIQRITVKELFEEYFEVETVENGIATRSRPKGVINALSVELETGEMKLTPVIDAIRLPSTGHLITFNLKLGRGFTTTPDHPVIVCEDGRLVEKRASEVKERDRMVMPRIDVPEANVESIDLLKEFANPSFSFLQDACAVRGIGSFTEGLVRKKGLAETARELGMSKKTLNNYYSERDSVPLSILLRLLGMHSSTIDDVPDCKIGFKRDDTLVNRYMPINNAFMRLAGYFLSEGFYRETKDAYQVDLAVSQGDLRDDMIACIREVFGDGFNPYVNESRITISNRAILHVFRDVIGFKATARAKRVPPFVFKLPLRKVANLISAYFSGDGGAYVERRTVDCTSFGRDLLVDLDFLLRRFGIFASLGTVARGDNLEHKLRIRGENVVTYEKEIGFTSGRKARSLHEAVLGLVGIMNDQEMAGSNRLVAVTEVITNPSTEQYVYSLNADTYHTVLVNDHVLTHQCDGDEDAVMLALDPMINFSREYLPSSRGGTMDAPLVLSVTIAPKEIDDEAHNIDVSPTYPLEFYERALRFADPRDIEEAFDLVAHRIGQDDQQATECQGFRFSHSTESINNGPRATTYTTLKTMQEKVDRQLALAKRLVAVDASDMARRLLDSHFLPDIFGNIRAFSTQTVRCTGCNAKFRRVPLAGVCPNCSGKLVLTVTKAGITKYVDMARRIAEDYGVPMYHKQRLELACRIIDSLFASSEGDQLQTKLGSFEHPKTEGS